MKPTKLIAIGTQIDVPVTGFLLKQALASTLFQRWTESLKPSLQVKGIEIQSVDIIQREGKEHVLFIKHKARFVGPDGKEFPNIVFLRGDAVGILIVLEDENRQHHVVLIKSAMLALGDPYYVQIPAGMTDCEDNIRAVAIREGKEETSIDFEDGGELINLCNLLSLPGANRGLLGLSASPGACDEKIHLFVYRKKVSNEFIANLQGLVTGLPGENERLKLEVVPFEKLPLVTYDMKTMAAYLMYAQALHLGLL